MSSKISQTSLTEAMEQFGLSMVTYTVEPYGNGHINDTFLVSPQSKDSDSKRYILQRINIIVFKNPDKLMENIKNVTGFLHEDILKNGGNPDRETLTVLPDKQGESMVKDSEGGCWRLYLFIERSMSYDTVDNPIVFHNAGAAFGRFMKRLAEYPAETLYETIPRFHDTKKRLADLQQAVKEDKVCRVKDVKREIDFFMNHKEECSILTDLLKKGELPLRVTHNDTKLNNVLFDKISGQGICVIDLDTVMPGLSLYDFGDSIRFGANTAVEDEIDLSKVSLSLDLFREYTTGYLAETSDVLTPLERELLPMGAKLMTLECGMRFLTDYLSGDVYFKTHRTGHNLDRARTQFKLVADMEQKWDTMKKIVKENG